MKAGKKSFISQIAPYTPSISLLIFIISLTINQNKRIKSYEELIKNDKDLIEVLEKSEKIYYWSGCMKALNAKTDAQAEYCADLMDNEFKDKK